MVFGKHMNALRLECRGDVMGEHVLYCCRYVEERERFKSRVFKVGGWERVCWKLVGLFFIFLVV